MNRKVLRFTLAALAVLALAATAVAAPLRKNRAIAVILYDVEPGTRYTSLSSWNYYGGMSYTHYASAVRGAALATETIRSALVKNGYKVVSDQVTARIVKAQPKQPGPGAVKKISRAHGVSQYVDGTVEVLDTIRNEFGMYTGSAVVMVHVYDSTGRTIFSDSAMGKEVGATRDESEIKAVRKAAEELAERITGVPANPNVAEGGFYVFVRGARDFKTVQSVVTACKTVYGVTS
ncbi:MAG: hypothetical protein MR616_01630, partial [Pyramidobacter sp.]|nr:hypothetical protein [Pyramidobacter sp.]